MINQYRVFQIKEVHHQHWAKSYVQQVEDGFLIHHQNYQSAYKGKPAPSDTPMTARKRLEEKRPNTFIGRAFGVGDVIVWDEEKGRKFFYVDKEELVEFGGFMDADAAGNTVVYMVPNYQIDGKNGNWMATDTIVIDGEQFYLMEHQKYGNQAQGVILDAYGKMIIEECERGFDEATKQKIHEYIQQHIPQNPVYQIRRQNHQRLEHYQKYYLNGTYERSRESGTEANYDMVDGMVNNQKNPAKVSNPQMNKKRSQNQRDHVPKKRRSVIKRLREKQIAIAVKSGKPIPKNLDQEMERHK